MEALLPQSWGWPADSRAVGKGAEAFLSGDTGAGLGLPLLCHCRPLAQGADVTLFRDPGEDKGCSICSLELGSRGENWRISREGFQERLRDTLGQDQATS